MRIPNLFMPGMAKSGTSTLHKMLITHIDIDGGGLKEPHTYCWDNKYIRRSEFFEKHYSNIDSKYILDSSTSYIIAENAFRRIIKDSPEAKFIVILRDPIDRIVSHFNWLSSKSLVNEGFVKEIMSQEMKVFNYRHHYNGCYKFYFDASMYGKHLKKMLKVISRDKIYFIGYENFLSEHEKKMVDIFDFLELPQIATTLIHDNKTDYKAEIAKKKSPLKRLKAKILHESKVFLQKSPRSLSISNPIYDKITRSDIEEIVFPIIEHDLIELNKLNVIDTSKWKTMHNFSI